ncbi:MAG: DUF559 domain-containing protein [Solirubrobacterales bacterium]|nr:DUF559 domain-containing protein [Solirubrobacterales bacterium]
MEPDVASRESSKERLRYLYGFMSRRSFVAHRNELRGAGISARQINSWVRNGRLIRILQSTYALGRDIETCDAAWRAATLAAGEGSALIARSACEKWGLVTSPEGVPTRIQVGSPVGQSRKLRGKSPAMRRVEVTVAQRFFEPGEIVVKDGVPLVNPVLALIEFAASESDRAIRFAFLEACRLKLLRRSDLEYCHVRVAGRRGATTLRRYLALWVPELGRVRSVLEGWFLLVWHGRMLAEPQLSNSMPQVNVKVHGVEVDFYWPEFGLVLETDGEAFHGGSVQKQIDLKKEQHLLAFGLTVLRTTFREFARDPEGVVDRVLDHQIRGVS